MAGLLLALSIAAQIAAVVVAIRLIWVTRQAPAWLLICAAILLMAIRRALSLYDFLSGSGPAPSALVETVALIISLLMLAGLVGIGRLFASLEQARRDLAASEGQLRDVMRTMNDGLEIIDADQRIVFVNQRMCDISGRTPEELLGRRISEVVDADQQHIIDRNWKLRQQGGNAPYEVNWTRPNGDRAHALISPCPRFDASGEFQGSIAVITDISSLKLAEAELRRKHEHERLLRREITHRVGNNLAMLLGLVEAGKGHADSVEQFAAALSERVAAMQRVHGVLSHGDWQGSRVRDVIHGALEPYAGDALTCHGPEIVLNPRESTALGLVLNEFAINAAKYGALRQPHGRVDLAWERVTNEAGEQVAFHWRERDGEPIAAPAREGLGTQLVRGLVESDLRGELTLSYPRDGAAHRFTITLDDE